ncbi:MAG: hypothetical protein VW307_03270 [Alphaproteobacteria bacterium]
MNSRNEPSWLNGKRKFGLFLFVTIVVAALYFGSRDAAVVFWTLASFAILVKLLILSNSNMLNLIYASWIGLGVRAGKVSNPIFIAFMFLLIIVPVGVLGRLIGRDELGLSSSSLKSYWINIDSSEESRCDFKRQF